MAFCGKCGAAITQGSAFCGSCGSRAEAAPAAPGGSVTTGNVTASSASAPAMAVNAPASAVAGTGLTSNVAAALAYLIGALTGILFLVIEPYKNDRSVRFHCFQSIFFNVATIAFFIATWIITAILSSLSLGILGLVLVPVQLLFSLAIFAYWIFIMYKAYLGQEYRIPFIGALAAKQAG